MDNYKVNIQLSETNGDLEKAIEEVLKKEELKKNKLPINYPRTNLNNLKS